MVMTDTLKSIIESCVTGDYDSSKLATFDLEYIFTQIRGKSVGEDVELGLRCICSKETCKDNNGEYPVVKHVIDISQIKVFFPAGHTDTINLFDGVGVKMKYPSLETLNNITQTGSQTTESFLNIVKEHIDYIFDDDSIYDMKQVSQADLDTFLEDLTGNQLKKLLDFFQTLPSLKHELKYSCPKCGEKFSHTLEGLNAFFS